MKIRIKFAKQGQMKFIGHLDIMRYFQKAIRRADIDISYTEGFSPHQKMSFAAPLGVGLLSRGEYFDIDVNTTKSSEKSLKALNDTMVEGMEVLSYRLLPEDAKNCMSVIVAADYLAHIKEENPKINEDSIKCFMEQKEILIIKKTKKSEKEVDIRPFVYEMTITDDGLFFKLAAGSVNNLKPELVMETLASYLDIEVPNAVYERLEMYAESAGDGIVPLESIGDIIE